MIGKSFLLKKIFFMLFSFVANKLFEWGFKVSFMFICPRIKNIPQRMAAKKFGSRKGKSAKIPEEIMFFCLGFDKTPPKKIPEIPPLFQAIAIQAIASETSSPFDISVKIVRLDTIKGENNPINNLSIRAKTKFLLNPKIIENNPVKANDN
jgi:hypothetical protein